MLRKNPFQFFMTRRAGGSERGYLPLLIALFLAVIATILVLVIAMVIPGTQLGPMQVSAQAVIGCDTCHNSWQPTVQGQACADCHTAQSDARLLANAFHIQVKCSSCHEGSDSHQFAADPAGVLPKTNYNLEVCEGCHLDQYNVFLTSIPGKTFFGGSDAGLQPPAGWSKTADFPFLNVLNSGHPSILESYEERGMMWSQLDLQQSILSKSEADVMRGGTKTAYYAGIIYLDASNNQVTIPPRLGTITADRSITTGTSTFDVGTGAWNPGSVTLLVPAGTTVLINVDAVNAPLYQVKTVVTLPDGRIYTSYDDPALAETARGDDPDPVIAAEARNWIYAALKALDFDELDFSIIDPLANPYVGEGYNWPSVESGMQCSQCHDPHNNNLRLVSKGLTGAIATRGINPYSPTGKLVKDINLATRQDQIIAVCGQCHSEQVAGYSANDRVDRIYFPWSKPDDIKDGAGNIILPGLDSLYPTLFSSLQDWTHGGPFTPWQSTDANARGFTPYGLAFPINAPLPMVESSEAETFMNSSMYTAGATCTDCHSARLTRFDGTMYTTHSYVSPLKLMDGYTGLTATGRPVVVPAQNPCVKCHITDTLAQSRQKILDGQTNFNLVQERTQLALVNALKFIQQQQNAGVDQAANIQTYRRSSLRWEFYTQAENSMSFHNNLEATTGLANARIWVDAFIPWPLTPVNVRITLAGLDALTLTFFDQANNEQGFKIERAAALEGPYSLVATIPTPNGFNVGDVSFTDTLLASGTTQFYRVIAYNVAGESVPSIWATGATTGLPIAAPSNLVATPVSSGQINLAWADNSSTETGFRVERAQDPAFSTGLTIFNAAANTTGFSDIGLASQTTYYYRVFAVGLNAVSAASNTSSATTLLAAPVAPPSNLAATPVSSSQINLTWADNSNDETGFRIERAKDAAFTLELTAFTAAANATSFNNVGLPENTIYYYRIFALRGPDTSTVSNTASTATLPNLPLAPSNLLITTAGQTSITIAWRDNSTNETGFYIERRIGNGAWVRIATLGPNVVTYTNTGLSRRTTYSYRVQAYNTAGASAYSNTVSAKTR